jgi:hypothetical protein
MIRTPMNNPYMASIDIASLQDIKILHSQDLKNHFIVFFSITLGGSHDSKVTKRLWRTHEKLIPCWVAAVIVDPGVSSPGSHSRNCNEEKPAFYRLVSDRNGPLPSRRDWVGDLKFEIFR